MDSIIFRRNTRKGGSCGCSKSTLQKSKHLLDRLQSKAANGAQQLSRQFYTMLGGKRSRKHKRTRRSKRHSRK